MKVSLHHASRHRLLAIVPADAAAVSSVLAAQTGRPVAALLVSRIAEHNSMELDSVIVALLEAGCEYFVCSGNTSEHLHDRIDEIVVERGLPREQEVVTTWHDDETAAEAAEFFFNIAAAHERSLMLAALEPVDDGLARLLVKLASG